MLPMFASVHTLANPVLAAARPSFAAHAVHSGLPQAHPLPLRIPIVRLVILAGLGLPPLPSSGMSATPRPHPVLTTPVTTILTMMLMPALLARAIRVTTFPALAAAMNPLPGL